MRTSGASLGSKQALAGGGRLGKRTRFDVATTNRSDLILAGLCITPNVRHLLARQVDAKRKITQLGEVTTVGFLRAGNCFAAVAGHELLAQLGRAGVITRVAAERPSADCTEQRAAERPPVEPTPLSSHHDFLGAEVKQRPRGRSTEPGGRRVQPDARAFATKQCLLSRVSGGVALLTKKHAVDFERVVPLGARVTVHHHVPKLARFAGPLEGFFGLKVERSRRRFGARD